ncbi:hypothetical protein [Fundidesulfovibrio putealis]|uniref:hypothetical protein n=1 Tax=Fundidesulfovibrio putealis TaxID=270496 RepID=UPI00040C4CA3|nr:hypothetical protein [Fundidesulfovibrio putealis]KAF0234878.1 MAG: hypothetical protein FD177_441 [Desulfovibrionaceae bacterium]
MLIINCILVVVVVLFLIRIGVNILYSFILALVWIGVLFAGAEGHHIPKRFLLYNSEFVTMAFASLLITVVVVMIQRTVNFEKKMQNGGVDDEEERPTLPGRYVYGKTDEETWTVGFFLPDGAWMPESDHTDPDAAAERVNFLNGQERQGVLRKAGKMVSTPEIASSETPNAR